MTKARRTLLAPAVYSLLGLACSYLVSVGFAVFGRYSVDDDNWVVLQCDDWPIKVPSTWTLPSHLTRAQYTGLTSYTYVGAQTVLDEDGNAPSWQLPTAILIVESGWPFRSSWWLVHTHGGSNGAFDWGPVQSPLQIGGAIAVRDGNPQDWAANPRAIPLWPRWDGLALNTLLYGGVALVLHSTARAVRRRRRKTGGGCVRCGYPIAGLGRCPECGHTPA